MKSALLLLVFILIVGSFASAQIVRDETFIPVSSQAVGSAEEGCFVACMTSMLVSLNDSRIGTNIEPILNALNSGLQTTGGSFPYPPSSVINVVINFLISVL